MEARRRAGNPYIFVTVGTTKFDALIQRIDSERFGDWLKNQRPGLDVVVQHGSGVYEPKSPWIRECYSFKPSIAKDMGGAELVITHAGSGSVLESLKLHRKTCVVVNTDLMDNHQCELAKELSNRGLVSYANGPDALMNTLEDIKVGENESTNTDDVLFPENSFTDFMSYDVHGGKRWEHGSLMVLGSGGHTTEMLWMLQSLPNNASGTTIGLDSLAPRRYLIADTDKMSQSKLDAFDKDCIVQRVKRSREVGQSYFTSIFTTILAFLQCFFAILFDTPSIVICNGPGTCIPVLLAVLIVRWLKWRDIETVYIESVARVEHLSLSGKIVSKLSLADRFVVQWPSLSRICGASALLRNFYFSV